MGARSEIARRQYREQACFVLLPSLNKKSLQSSCLVQLLEHAVGTSMTSCLFLKSAFGVTNHPWGEGAGIGTQKCIFGCNLGSYLFLTIGGRGGSLSNLENPVSHFEKIRFLLGKINCSALWYFLYTNKSSQSPLPRGCRTRAKNRHGLDFICGSHQVGGWVWPTSAPAFKKKQKWLRFCAGIGTEIYATCIFWVGISSSRAPLPAIEKNTKHAD